MKRDISKLSFWTILTLRMASFYIFMTIVPYPERVFLMIFVLLLTLFSFSWSLLQSFTLLISGVLITSLYYVLLVWYYRSLTQIEGILYSLISIIFTSLTWILVIYIKKYVEENKNLQARIKDLEKYNYELGVLTLNEFMEKAEMIFAILKRRGGNAVALKIKLKEFTTSTEKNKWKVSKGLMKILSQAILSSIRREFDIAGICSQNTLIILLQNTKAPQLIIDRIKNNLSNIGIVNFDNLIKDLEFELNFFEDNFQHFKEFIEKNCVGEKQ